MRLSDIEESSDPTGWFSYSGLEFPYWGNPRGHYHTVDYDLGKFNRFAKIGEMADDLVSEFTQEMLVDQDNIDARCAYACLLMMEYGIRVGNESSAEGYVSKIEATKGQLAKTYGVTTLLNKHIGSDKGVLRLHFLGKEQVEQSIDVHNDFLVESGVHYLGDSPEERWLRIDYDTLFKYVRRAVGSGFVPKDFRTFCANTHAWAFMKDKLDNVKYETISEAKDELGKIVDMVSGVLGNTPSVARSSYLDDRLMSWFVRERLKSL